MLHNKVTVDSNITTLDRNIIMNDGHFAMVVKFIYYK